MKCTCSDEEQDWFMFVMALSPLNGKAGRSFWEIRKRKVTWDEGSDGQPGRKRGKLEAELSGTGS